MCRQLLIVLALVTVVGCQNEPVTPAEKFPAIPAHMPPMPQPPDNPITREKATLGHQLFYERRLSSDGSISCASCHRPESSFADAPNQVSAGIGNQLGQRNSPTIINSGYRRTLFWDGRAASLEEQAMAAFTNTEEMNADTIAVANLMRSSEYRALWQKAFGDTLVTMHRVMQAIATWERTLVAGNSRYDHYATGNLNALNEQEKQGMQLFFSDKTSCSECHSGPDFTNDEYMNVGLFSHYFDGGRFEFTRNHADQALFKTPTLRNVALTPPYEAGGDNESGVVMTLEAVVSHYNSGGKPFSRKDKRVRKLNLSDAEQAALVAFLKTLTDSSVMNNPMFTAP